MKKTLSVDLRERIVAAYDTKEGTREEVAKRFKVSVGMVKKLLWQRARTGDLRPRHRFSGRKARLIPDHGAKLKQLIAREPDLTLAEMKSRLELNCTVAAIHWVVGRLGLTYKKRRSMPAEQNRPDVARARRRWQRRQGALDPARLVFIDESAAKTNLTRLRGRAPKGERLICHAPHGHWHTSTMISSVRLDGTSACMTIEGATGTEVFQAYVREVLVPALRAGDIVIMDNLGAHKNDHTLALIAQAGAEVRFLPAYSPDLNPIEMMWSKVKSLLRKAQARTHQDLLLAIAAALRAVTAQDALGWFAACGYSFI